MAISVVQRNKAGNAAAASSIALAFASNTAAGNALIAIATTDGADTTLTGVSDTQSLAWNLVFTQVKTSGFSIKAWIAYGSSAAGDTITAMTGFNDSNLFIFEVAGLATSSAFDKSAAAGQAAATALSSGATATLTNNNNLVLGVTANTPSPGLAPTVGAGFSNLQTLTTNFNGGGTEEQIVASTSPVTATFGLAANSGTELTAVLVFSDTAIGGGVIAHGLMTMGVGA